MYEKHQMDVIGFDEADVFVDIGGMDSGNPNGDSGLHNYGGDSPSDM